MDFLYKKELDIINNINAAILYCKNDEFSTILYANQYFYDLIGYTKKEMETIFNNRFADLVIDDVSEILVKVEEIISKGENLDFEFRMRRKDNSIIWLHDTAVYNKENNTFYVTLMDITYMKSIEYQKEKLNNYLNNITNKVIITDINGIIEYKNNEAENNNIYPKINENIKDYISENIIGYYKEELWDLVKNGESVEYETRVKINNSFLNHDKNQLIPIKDDLGKISNIMQISESVMKNNDLITHFPDRIMFKDYYEKVKLFIEDNFNIYIILLDIDNFKNLNDIYGHIIGDKIISETADKITSIISKKDYVCRYGGDEFIILLIEENDENIINKLMKIVETPSNNKELNGINITYSIGVAKQIDKLLSYFNLVDLADKALYNVKRKGKDNICFASDFKLIK
ncbi:sensor domain-containing diguanylate cyclase [Paraclostridium bifermentans]|jgi:diguanylate cyclase (GGDEF)-like protein/PAS domain S-box-containing protein|uniref:sensor domain-containing diguanylate cyclase n=2 Tax=Clostridia TaxID=186801 RepID=UPI0011DD9468|nr:diguanylate cyclase [Paraclostridium bifermentans]